MPPTVEEITAALNAFVPDSGYDQNQSRLYPITEGFQSLTDRERVVPAMFSLMERYPNAYLGTPGPLVHCIESLGVARYERLLVESVQRQPADLNVWMLNRILNSRLDPAHRRRLLEVLRAVPAHPAVPPRVAESACHFLEHQAKRES